MSLQHLTTKADVSPPGHCTGVSFQHLTTMPDTYLFFVAIAQVCHLQHLTTSTFYFSTGVSSSAPDYQHRHCNSAHNTGVSLQHLTTIHDFLPHVHNTGVSFSAPDYQHDVLLQDRCALSAPDYQHQLPHVHNSGVSFQHLTTSTDVLLQHRCVPQHLTTIPDGLLQHRCVPSAPDYHHRRSTSAQVCPFIT